MLMVHHLKAFNTKTLLNENLKIKMDELIHPQKTLLEELFIEVNVKIIVSTASNKFTVLSMLLGQMAFE